MNNPLRLFTRILLLIVGATAILHPAMAQEAEPVPGVPGTEYYVAFPQNDDSRAGTHRFMGLLISSEVSTVGTVDIPGIGPKSFSVQPGQTVSIPVDRALELRISEDDPGKNAVRVTSRAPISVTAVNALSKSSGSYAALPVSHWGTQYLAMSMPNANGDGQRAGEFTIVAGYDSTWVTVIPNARTIRRDASQSFSFWMKPGEAFLVQAAPCPLGPECRRDLSATEIIATKPVGLITGHMHTSTNPAGSFDPSLWASQQLMMQAPNTLHGRDYLTIPQSDNRSDIFRLIALADNTTITFTQNGGSTETITLNRGEISTRLSSVPTEWSGSAPFILAQVRSSGTYGDPFNSPALTPVAPRDKFATRTAFSVPNDIAGERMTSSILRIIARGPATAAPSDSNNPLRDLLIDGRPIHELAPEILTQQIGSTEYYYAVVRNIASGGHSITSRSSFPFTGTISSGNGDAAGDAYTALLPFWLDQISLDVTAPHIETVNALKGTVTAKISDQTPAYFSGVASITPEASPGWIMLPGFITPEPDNAADVTFRAIADPSGPLMARLSDRDGNDTLVQFSAGVCFKTAIAAESEVVIYTPQGGTPTRQLQINANPCGDEAHVVKLDLGFGDATGQLEIFFEKANAPFSIPSNGSATLTFRVKPGALGIRTYTTTVRITVDDSVLVIPVTLNVGPPSSVAVTGAPVAMLSATVYPNPLTSSTTIALSRPTGRAAQVAITDAQGREIVRFDAASLSGRTSFTWDGADNNGEQVPAGAYFLTITDEGRRMIHGITVIR
jgi:hypothetical protein